MSNSILNKKNPEPIIAKMLCEEMLTRLDFVKLEPELILDVSWDGADYSRDLLQKRFPEATILAYESYNLQENKEFDLIFANIVLSQTQHIEPVIKHWKNLLRPNGLLVFTTFGPSTLTILQPLLGNSLHSSFIDMHLIGDALTKERFVDPVLDTDVITLVYSDVMFLLDELRINGILIDKLSLSDLSNIEKIKNAENKWEATYELVFGQAWAASDNSQSQDEFGIVKFPLAHLRRGKKEF